MATSAYSDPISQGTNTAPAALPSLDYTAQDYGTIKRFLVTLAAKHFGDQYNNLVEHDFGVMLLEFIAALHDHMSFKVDFAANEAFYNVAIQEKSVRRHARKMGYIPRAASAARYEIVATVVRPYEFDVVIPSGFRIAQGGSDGRILYIELYAADEDGSPIADRDIVIPAGTDSITNIVGLEGQSTTVESDGTGEPFQSFTLPEGNVLPESVRLEVDGTEWSRVDIFAINGPEKVFKVDQDDRTGQWYVVVGNDRSGSVVPLGARAIVRYRTGGGLRGNVPAGFINISQAVPVPGTGVNASVTFSNITRGYGGGEAETIEEIRQNLPFWIKSQGRLNSLEDYTSFASRFLAPTGRVARGRAYLRNSGCAGNVIDLFIVENGSPGKPPVAPSDSLMRSLREECEDINDCTHHLCVRRGTIVSFDTRVHLTLPTALSIKRSALEALAKTSVESYFSLQLWNFGMPLLPNDLSRYLGSIIPQALVDVRFDMYPGFSTEPDGSYKAMHNELVRPASIEITVDFSNQILRST